MSEFREMRRKRQQLSNDESVAILEKATAGTLALLGDDDYPYTVPISYVYYDGKFTSTAHWLAIRWMLSASVIRHLSVSSSSDD